MEELDPELAGQESQSPPLPPQPVKREAGWSPLSTALGLLVVAGGGLLLLTTAFTGRTLGVTRSSRLQWEERDQQVEAVILEQDAASTADQEGD